MGGFGRRKTENLRSRDTHSLLGGALAETHFSLFSGGGTHKMPMNRHIYKRVESTNEESTEFLTELDAYHESILFGAFFRRFGRLTGFN